MKLNTSFFSELSHHNAYLVIVLILISSCQINNVENSAESNLERNDDNPKWLVPQQEVIDGGPGKDGIPPIEKPKFTSATEIDFIPDERRVIGVKLADKVHAYPIQILDWHEIVNHKIIDRNVAITYCPLTATSVAWIPRNGSEFGTSGRIFRNNLVAYDRNTQTFWSQMRARAIHGERIGESLKPLNIIETTWRSWKKMYPQSNVLTTETGFDRNYQTYAYGEAYATTDDLILFPPKYDSDTRLPAKTRVYAVVGGKKKLTEDSPTHVYEMDKFGTLDIIHNTISERDYVVIGSNTNNFALAFETVTYDGTALNFKAVRDRLPIIMNDQEGNLWNVFGEAVKGPRKGEELKSILSYSGYWFGIRDLFYQPEIYAFDTQ